MIYIIFLQIVTTYLASFLPNSLKGYNLFEIRDFGRISFNCPPPPAQVYFQTSADYADDFFIRSLSNTTATTPPSFLLNATTFSSNTTDTSLPPVSSSPLLRGILDVLVQISIRIVSIAVEILVGTLQALTIIASPATVAFALGEQRRHDMVNLEVKSDAFLDNFWEQVSKANDQDGVIAGLRADLDNSENELESQQERFERQLKALKTALIKQQGDSNRRLERMTNEANTQRKEQDASVQTLRKEQDAYVQTLRKEQDAIVQTLRKEQDALVQTLQNFRTRETASHDSIRQLQLTVEQQAETIKEREAEQQSGRQAAEKNDGDLRLARQHIESLQTTIRTNAQELQLYRERERAQRQAGYQNHPPPSQMPIPTFSQGQQGPFAPRPPQFNGFPPNRTSGFMGNTPPPGWGR